MAGLSLDVSDTGSIVRHVGEDESLFAVVLAEDLVLARVEADDHAEPATRHVYCHHEQQLVAQPFCMTRMSAREKQWWTVRRGVVLSVLTQIRGLILLKQVEFIV
jgi:hypothetical protein